MSGRLAGRWHRTGSYIRVADMRTSIFVLFLTFSILSLLVGKMREDDKIADFYATSPSPIPSPVQSDALDDLGCLPQRRDDLVASTYPPGSAHLIHLTIELYDLQKDGVLKGRQQRMSV